MKIAQEIGMSQRWSKLSRDAWHTWRWNDTVYPIATPMPVVLLNERLYTVKVLRTELARPCDLSDEWIHDDADCTRERFMQMLKNWYQFKPDWNGEESEGQAVYVQRIPLQNVTKTSPFKTSPLIATAQVHE
jgi:hypothetical protein